MIPKAKTVLELTQPLYHNAPGPPIFPLPQIERTNITARDHFNMEKLTMVTHTGTHLDAPYHFIEKGAKMDEIDPVKLQGTGVIVDLLTKKPKEEITADDLRNYDELIKENSIVLLCTGWGYKRDFTKEYLYHSPWLTEEAAEYLVKKKIRGVGIDHFSLAGVEFEQSVPTHLKILGANIWILEDLFLPRVLLEREEWYIVALPLLLKGGSGAPARVIAIEFEEDD